MRKPGGQGGDDVSTGGPGEVFGLCGEFVDTDLVGTGQVLDTGDRCGDVAGQVGEE